MHIHKSNVLDAKEPSVKKSIKNLHKNIALREAESGKCMIPVFHRVYKLVSLP